MFTIVLVLVVATLVQNVLSQTRFSKLFKLFSQFSESSTLTQQSMLKVIELQNSLILDLKKEKEDLEVQLAQATEELATSLEATEEDEDEEEEDDEPNAFVKTKSKLIRSTAEDKLEVVREILTTGMQRKEPIDVHSLLGILNFKGE